MSASWTTMYGTRDAPAAWQEELECTLACLGFRACVSTPCLYLHPESQIRIVAHVDDMLCVGNKEELEEFMRNLAEIYKFTSTFLGPEKTEQQEGEFLGRKLRWGAEGLTWSGSQKLVDEMLEEWGMSEAHALDTPGLLEAEIGGEDWEEPMEREEAAKYRRTAAKLNYVSLDHPQIAFAAKEASRTMANPKKGDERKIKRLLRYLRGHPVATYQYKWQNLPENMTGFSDSDWAGCRRSRRSTSGGLILHGAHLISHWSRTQPGVALSSGEAELNAALKLGCEILGVRQFSVELGFDYGVHIYGDSSVVKGMLSRKGCGKVKHIEVKQLWLQERVRAGEIDFRKVPRSSNPSDALTHHCAKHEAKHHYHNMNLT